MWLRYSLSIPLLASFYLSLTVNALAQDAPLPPEESPRSDEVPPPEVPAQPSPAEQPTPPSDAEKTPDTPPPAEPAPSEPIEEAPPPSPPSAPPPEAETAPSTAPLAEPEPSSDDAASDASELSADELAGMSLEELLQVNVVTATKTEVSLGEAPANVSVVTREELLRWGYSSLAEVLHHTVGFYVIDDHVQPSTGVRGIGGGLFTENGFIKVMIDGQSVAFRSEANNWIGPELVPLSAVERIEIIRGPASALYGADAFLATVNIITRKGESIQGGTIRSSIQLFRDQDPAQDFDATIGGRNGRFELTLSGRVRSEDRSGLRLPSSSPSPNIPSYRTDRESDGADHSTKSLFGKASYHLNDTDSVSLVGYYSEFERGSEFSPWAQLPYGLDADGRPHQTRIALRQARLGSTGHVALGEKSALDYRLFFGAGGPTSADQIDVGSTIFDVKREFGFQSVEGAVDVSFPLVDGLDLVASADASVDNIELPYAARYLKVSTDDALAGSRLDSGDGRPDRRLSNVGLLLQARWTDLAPLLTLTGGARLDYHSIYGAVPSGRLGAVSKPHEDVTLKLLYGTAFKAPSPLLLFGVPLTVGDIIGNPDLDPQRVHTVELQSTWMASKIIALSTGVTYSRLIDGAQFVQQGVNRTAQNLSSIDTLSWESEARIASEQRGVSLAYELQRSVRELGLVGYAANVIGETEQPRYPEHIVRLNAWSTIPGVPLQLGAQAQYASARVSSDNNSLERGASYELDPILLVDAIVSTHGLQFLKGRETQLMAKLRNAIDVDEPEPGFAGVDYPLLPASLTFQLRQEL